MTTTLLITDDVATLADTQSCLARAERRLMAAAARRNAARWAVARTLPTTPDWFWLELNEAELQYRAAWKARDEHVSRGAAQRRN